MKHILSIRVKVLLVLIPVIAAAMIIMSQQSAKTCTEIVNNQIEQSMHNSLSSIENSVNGRLDVVESTAKNISDLISNSYKTGVTLEAYEDVLSDIIQENDMVLGSGLWFEPKVFDPDEEYVGPYVTKDGDKINVTMEYSNADYDYFNQEYYQNAKNAKKGEALITDPYYDATSGLIMSTCSTPIYDGDKYIGCVTVDMELGQINDFISSIKVGKAGNAMLLSSEGVYIAGVSDEILQNANKITEDKNASLAAAGQSVMNTETGDATYTDDTGTEYKMFYSVIPDTGWHIIAQLPATELTEDVDAMTATQNRILIIALIVSSIAVFLIISYITHTIKQVQKFSDHLANGDLTVKELKNKSHDELGSMAQALNNMFRQNRKMIGSIADHSEKMFNSSQGLKDASENLRRSLLRSKPP